MGIYQDKRNNSPGVKKLHASLKIILTVSAALIATCYGLIIVVFEGRHVELNPWLTLGIGIIGIPLCYFIILSVEDGKHIDGISKLINFFIKDDYVGNWVINIQYENNEKKSSRNGSCNLEKSILGLKLNGGKILDENGVVTTDDWNSNNVELIEYTDKTILIYTYFTYDQDASILSKIGIAILTKKNAKNNNNIEFDGVFYDYYVIGGLSSLSGTVKLFK